MEKEKFERFVKIRLTISNNEPLNAKEEEVWQQRRESPAGQWAQNFTAEDVKRSLISKRINLPGSKLKPEWASLLLLKDKALVKDEHIKPHPVYD